MRKVCEHCSGFGYVKVYWTTVMRLYCDCEAGDRRIEEVKEALREVGLDPESPNYTWTRRSEVVERRNEQLKKGDLVRCREFDPSKGARTSSSL